MNIPNFKVIIQKLSVFRHNIALLRAVIIGVVAIAIFIPTQLISSKLKRQIATQSIAQGQSIASNRKDALSSTQWQEERKYQQFYAKDANQIELIAKGSSQRPLLSYRIFPEPKDQSASIYENFGKRFRLGIEQLFTKINATDRPTDAELERSVKSSSSRSRFRGRMTSPRNSYSYGGYFSRGSVKIADDIDAMMVDEICREKAQSGLIYAHPTDVSGYEFWEQYQYIGRDEAVKDCWFWQLGYWIIEDVFDTISACNSGSKSVFTSPVKRLMRVSFILSEKRLARSRSYMNMSRGAGKKLSEDKPHYVISVQDGLTVPCTERFCDEDIDVIHFNVVVLVGADAVLPFMQKLCSAKEHKFPGWQGELDQEETFKHNQITILESNITPVEREFPEHQLYLYGDDAVVELDLICEYIFNKAGYDEVKPKLIKDEMKGEEEGTQ
jgi:hypothetical protein